MKTLSSQDELLLLAVISVEDEAYGVTIRRKVSEVTGKDWSIGAIYDPLYRLEERGFLVSCMIEPTGERGGRSKRIFTVTDKGRKALVEHRRVREEFWAQLPGLTSEAEG